MTARKQSNHTKMSHKVYVNEPNLALIDSRQTSMILDKVEVMSQNV